MASNTMIDPMSRSQSRKYQCRQPDLALARSLILFVELCSYYLAKMFERMSKESLEIYGWYK